MARQDEVREDGILVDEKGWKEGVYKREELKKLQRMARNHRILHMLMEWMNECTCTLVVWHWFRLMSVSLFHHVTALAILTVIIWLNITRNTTHDTVSAYGYDRTEVKFLNALLNPVLGSHHPFLQYWSLRQLLY